MQSLFGAIKLIITGAVAVYVASSVFAQVPAASSSNYELFTYTLNGGGEFATSASFELHASLGLSAIQWSAYHHEFFAGGFWVAFGGAPVPIELRLFEGLIDPDDVLLDWSWAGFPASYQIYRSVNPNDVLSMPLTLSSGTMFEDPASDGFTVLFYLVEPGP